jgi:hypothetical protein
LPAAFVLCSHHSLLFTPGGLKQIAHLFNITDKTNKSNSRLLPQDRENFRSVLSVLCLDSLNRLKYDCKKKGDEEIVKYGIVEIKKSINYHREDNDKSKQS